MAESEEERKSLLKVKEESEKSGLKLNIQKTKVMVPGPLSSWQIDGETVTLHFWGSKITADGDCSHKIKRHLLLGRKVMINLYSILKSREITLPTAVCLVKAMVFPVVIYGYESWTMKKAECWRNDAFELWCWRRLLSPLDCKEIQSVPPKRNQSWIFIGRTDAEAEAPILWPPDVKNSHLKRSWCWERMKVGGEGVNRGWHGWMASLTQWTWVWASSGSCWWTWRLGMLQSMGLQRVGHDWGTELNWS